MALHPLQRMRWKHHLFRVELNRHRGKERNVLPLVGLEPMTLYKGQEPKSLTTEESSYVSISTQVGQYSQYYCTQLIRTNISSCVNWCFAFPYWSHSFIVLCACFGIDRQEIFWRLWLCKLEISQDYLPWDFLAAFSVLHIWSVQIILTCRV